LRILTALTYYYPHWTGLTAFAQRIAEGLAARGHQVTVVTSRYSRELPAEETHRGVRIVRVPAWFRLSRGQVMPSYPAVVRRLLREHDVAQVHTPMLETGLVAWLAHRAGRKVLMTHHGDLVMPASPWDQMVQRVVGALLNWGADEADRISIYTDDYVQNSAFLRPHAAKTVPILPPVVFPPPDEDPAAWRHELGLDGSPLIGFAGRFVHEKGFDYLLQAIPLVREQYPQAKFVFAGEHRVAYERFYECCRPLLEQHGDHLVTLGLIRDPAALARFYAMCDVFCLPSRTDCFASVQVEAMLSGTPVVATDIPGARQVVKLSGMGTLVAPHDPAALAEGIVRVIRDRQAYVRPREEIEQVFSVERAIVAYEELLQSLI
jgi:glycosyltransferase involved in cell wall biosynthesis